MLRRENLTPSRQGSLDLLADAVAQALFMRGQSGGRGWPRWVAILDFETRFPSALERAIARVSEH